MRSSYPWYDSHWLAGYHSAHAWLARERPGRERDLDALVAPLRTDPGFTPRTLPGVFDARTMADIRDAIASLAPLDLELHEARRFGRFVVHDHPLFVALAPRLAETVAQACGEPVVPCYTFLALYTRSGRCEPHMDTPHAKWTLDLCVDTNVDWPIHFSPVVPWPSPATAWDGDWQARVRDDPRHAPRSVTLHPGEAVVFGGSSQWHWRDPMPPARDGGVPYCTLLFFHFLPRGTEAIVEPGNWPALLGVPELASALPAPVASPKAAEVRA